MKTTNKILIVLATILLINTTHASTDLSITSDKSTYKQGESAEFKIIFTVDSGANAGYCKIDDINLTFKNGKTTACALPTTGHGIPGAGTLDCGFNFVADETGCGSYGEGDYGNQINYTITGKIPSTWSAGSYTATADAVSAGESYSDSKGFTITSTTTTTTLRSSGGKSGGGGGGAPRSGGGINQPKESCFDGLKNQDEEGVDCGGSCKPCASCSDRIQNQGEEGIDCGGPCKSCSPPTTIKTTTTTLKEKTTTTQKTTTTTETPTTTTSTQKATTTTTTPQPPTTIPLEISIVTIAAIGLILMFVIYRTMNK